MEQRIEPEREPAIAIPRAFLERGIERVHDLAELKVMLVLFRLAANRAVPFVAEAALYDDSSLIAGLRLRGSALRPDDEIRRGIELAVAHDLLVRFRIDGAAVDMWLMPASPENRLLLTQLQRGSLAAPAWSASIGTPARFEVERPNVFRLYEQNIGMITPLIADRIIEAIEIYPEDWITEAISAAVGYNRRSWRYIQRILERWATEGRGDEADQRGTGAENAVQPDKYLRGKYADLFRRRQ